ncbi:MAG: cupin domain-containing protein [Methanoregula sp.]|jgi:quercetin dioxygenase-like cupin family protein|nr:cupin domain-containing protein [Methanoregula sp.]
MDPKRLMEIFEQGGVFFPETDTGAVTQPWYSHHACEGVFLKDLVKGKETGGKFSYHIVRVSKDCKVMDHNHETQWEWNLVISGKGIFVIGDKEVTMAPGQTFITPPTIHHTVSAGDEDLSLMALFIPALM